MKKTLLPIVFMILAVFMFSCVGDDIEDLQSQIDALRDQVEELELSQQEALLAAITALQEQIAALESGNATQYQALLDSLLLLEEEVANNESAIYYGNLLTDEDFAAFLAQGATVVTGKVIATTQTHIEAMAAIKMVGGSLTIKGGSTILLPELQNVGGSFIVTEVSNSGATISLASLISVGENLTIKNNNELVSFTADALVLINNTLHTEKNSSMTKLSLAALDVTESVDINEYWMDNPDYSGASVLTEIDLSGVNVQDDFYIAYVDGGELTVGSIGNDFTCVYTKLTSLTINSDSIGGNFTLEYSGYLETIDVSTITKISGDIKITQMNTWGGDLGSTNSGIEQLPAFASLVSIGGDVIISTNAFLTSLEIFNNVTEFTGDLITTDANGSSAGLAFISMFNALEEAGSGTYPPIDINVVENTEWFNAFNSLLTANYVKLTVNGIMDPVTYMNGPTRISGFDAMTDCRYLELYAANATEFDAFPSLNNFNTSYQYPNCCVIDIPSDINVGMCSMEGIFTKILNGDFDTKPAIFRYSGSEMVKEDAINQLTASCI